MRWCWLTCMWNLGCLGSYAHEALSVASPRLLRKTMVWCGVFQTSAISGPVVFYLSSLTDFKVVTGLWCWLHEMENVQGLVQVCICQCDWPLCSLFTTGGAGWLWERVLSHEAICWVSSDVNFVEKCDLLLSIPSKFWNRVLVEWGHAPQVCVLYLSQPSLQAVRFHISLTWDGGDIWRC